MERTASGNNSVGKHEQIYEAEQDIALGKLDSQEEVPVEKLHRGLKSRQIGMIALGGAIGTGLIIGTGSALSKSGPAGTLLAYSLVGAVVYMVMCALGEMATMLPDQRGFTGYASRFVDPALGFATGWNYWFKYIIVVPNQLTAGALVIQYWNRNISVAVWISIFIVMILAINVLGVKVFGEVEFWMSTLKVVVICGLLILCVCLAAGAGPTGQAGGFKYWKNPGAFKQYLVGGNLGYFLAVWSTTVQATFAFLGTELVGVCVGEAQNPRRNVPKAIRRTFWRILIFYIGLVFLLGLIVPYNSPDLLGANKRSNSAAASPFVVAIKLSGIKILPDILNGCILLFVLSAANSDLYIASRTLYNLAADGKAPAILARTTKSGLPYVSLGVSSLFALLAYLNVSSSSQTVFKYFVQLVSVFGLLTWISILVSHIGFRRGLKAQNISPSSLPYTAPFQPYGTYIALFFSILITIFKGFDTMVHKFDYKNFITQYLGVPLYLMLILGYKVATRCKRVRASEIDFVSGTRDFASEYDEYIEKQAIEDAKPKVWYKVIWKYTGGALLG
ncbi:amino acid permease Dip5 [Protomyces lactucae-debilis]|uniref:Amino acid permease Dip5 n=1 Tax=Protomyces lactucae-debilis TaxID=2754530 RepID=A0A1Y2F4Z8_PROLT|nr:amino acid permease Dip5 [Protomyces lactucae-debilis]ORY78952.1 amino acid permease Dip5 [Protomyces lactucae-debilis]